MRGIKTIFIALLAIVSFRQYTLAQTKPVNESLNAAIANYLGVKNALAANDGAAAEIKAKALLTSLNDLHLDGANAALLTKLQYDSRHISEVDRLPHQREHFASLSDNFYALLKSLKANKMPLYREYCSMTKRYYLTDTQKDKDPYMGMSNCSKVTETL